MFPEDNLKYLSTATASLIEDDSSERDTGWYVLRYRVLSQWLRDRLKNASVEIFHPYKFRKIKGGHHDVMLEVPVLSGYVFVHASFEATQLFAQDVNLPIMLNPFWEDELQVNISAGSAQDQLSKKASPPSRYVCISHKAMQPFMKAAEMRACDLNFFDPNVIDVQKDDYVEFISGDLQGVKGYLKAGKGRNGGLVIVPLVFGGFGGTQSKMHLDRTVTYALSAHQDEVAVIAFAKGNRHAKDCVFDIKPVLNEAFEVFVQTGKVSPQMQEKLICYVRRYGRSRLNTDIQTTQHSLVLYRINTILGNYHLCAELREKIVTEILPDLQRRRNAALKRNNAKAAGRHEELLREFEATDAVFLKRQGLKE